MKKIFIVAIAIMLCSVMLIPVSASSFNYNNLPTLEIDDDYSAKFDKIILFKKIGYNEYLLELTTKEYYLSTGWYMRPNESKNTIEYSYRFSKWQEPDAISSTNPNSKEATVYEIVWANYDVKNENGEVIYIGDFEHVCDGSTCPATDANTDNICDDCGNVFAVLRQYDSPDPYLAWTADRQANFPYAFIYKNEIDANVFIMASTRPYVQDGQIVIDTNGDTTSYLKYTQWGNDWRLAESYDSGTSIIADTLVSSFNIYDTDGNIVYNHDTDFFPVPLWVEMDNLTQGEMVNKFSPTVVGLMVTLMVCGVGLLALLVVLKLFGKRSLLFLK